MVKLRGFFGGLLTPFITREGLTLLRGTDSLCL